MNCSASAGGAVLDTNESTRQNATLDKAFHKVEIPPVSVEYGTVLHNDALFGVKIIRFDRRSL